MRPIFSTIYLAFVFTLLNSCGSLKNKSVSPAETDTTPCQFAVDSKLQQGKCFPYSEWITSGKLVRARVYSRWGEAVYDSDKNEGFWFCDGGPCNVPTGAYPAVVTMRNDLQSLDTIHMMISVIK